MTICQTERRLFNKAGGVEFENFKFSPDLIRICLLFGTVRK